ncbi:hypothetical protein KM043_005499 [Ampulex compressa]|nr:hypothetical protein KM043_005499 [Ampulex compressa]
MRILAVDVSVVHRELPYSWPPTVSGGPDTNARKCADRCIICKAQTLLRLPVTTSKESARDCLTNSAAKVYRKISSKVMSYEANGEEIIRLLPKREKTRLRMTIDFGQIIIYPLKR